MAEAENAQLKKTLQETDAEMTTFREKIKLKLAGQISERRRLVEKADALQGENSRLAEQLAARGGGGGGGGDDDDDSGDEAKSAARASRRATAAAKLNPEDAPVRSGLIVQIREVAKEIEMIQLKVRHKVQQLVIEKHAASARLKELESTDSGRVQELRAQHVKLQEEKTTLAHTLSEHKTTLQNAKMWRTQNEHLAGQIKRVTEQQVEARGVLERIAAATEKALEEKNVLRGQKKTAGALAEKRKRKLDSERESSANAGQWSQQNEFLAEQIKKLVAANTVLEAQVADKQIAGSSREGDALAAQLAANEKVIVEAKAGVERLTAETAALVAESAAETAALEVLVPEVTGLKMRIQSLDRAVQSTHSKNAKLRQAMLDVEQESSAGSLKANMLIARLEQIAELEAENDELRFGIQELLDQSAALKLRKEHLMFASFKKPKAEETFDIEAGVEELLAQDEGGDGSATPSLARSDSALGAMGSGDPQSPAAAGAAARSGGGLTVDGGSPGMRATELKRIKTRSYSEAKLGEIKRLMVGTDVKDNMERISLNAAAQADGAAAAADGGGGGDSDDYFKDKSEIKFLPVEDAKAGTYPAVKCGTLERLVERLTFEKYPDMEYVQAFMLTYRSFTTPQTLMELLIARYCITPPGSLDADATEAFKTMKVIPIRLRVYNVLRGWVEKYPRDFEAPDMLAMLREFADNTMSATGMKGQARKLLQSMDKLLAEQQAKKPKFLEFERLPAKQQLSDWMSINLKEYARSMSVIEMDLYASIPVTECLSNRWAGTNKAETAPCIFRSIDHFNQTTLWVTTECVRNERLKPKARGKVFAHFIKLAVELKELNNFNGVMEVVAGLSNSSVKRLKKAWKTVDSKLQGVFEELKQLTANYKSYALLRQHIHVSRPPCVPYLGIYLTDLTFIEDGNPSKIDGMVNFVKQAMAANVIREILQYQVDQYAFTTTPALVQYIMAPPNESDDACFEMSLAAEPRE